MRRILSGRIAVPVAVLIAGACGRPPISPSPPPPPVNTPPQIKSIALSDTRVEVGTPVTLSAVVEDQETPPANLIYAWSGDTGTFTGTGAVVTWTPGADARTPGDYVVTLTVTERYTSGSDTLENKATGTTTAHVNNSLKELADLSIQFLTDFADSRVSPDKCVSVFSDSCASGRADEFDDIAGNRHDLLILSSTLRPTGVSMAPSRLTATVHTFCSFTSQVISKNPVKCIGCVFGSVGTTSGDCYTTDVYERGRWWLCESHYASESNSLSAFQRALEKTLFGARRRDVP